MCINVITYMSTQNLERGCIMVHFYPSHPTLLSRLKCSNVQQWKEHIYISDMFNSAFQHDMPCDLT